MVNVRRKEGQHGAWCGPPGAAVLQPDSYHVYSGARRTWAVSNPNSNAYRAGAGFPAAIGYCWTTALANVDSFTHKVVTEREIEEFSHFSSPPLHAFSFPALVVGKYSAALPFQGQTHAYVLALPSCSM